MVRRLLLSIWLLVLASALCVYASESVTQTESASPSGTAMHSRPLGPTQTLDETVYLETWETGDLDGWTPVELMDTTGTWHTDTLNAFGGTGHSWWVGDPTVGPHGGYKDDQIEKLESPSITLPATNPTLLFYHRFKAEPAYVAPPDTFPTGYNAWDAMNLRISTDDGATWTVVSNVTPAYNHSSCYSFGWMHCEGHNVPGWTTDHGAVTTDQWHAQTANLSNWAGQTVRLRWVFASDPAFSTAIIPGNGGDTTMFGWMIDNIRVYQTGGDTVFSDNGDNATGWAISGGHGLGGTPWRVEMAAATDTGNTSHVLVCNDLATHLYHPNMQTALMSPYITLGPRAFGTVKADIYVGGDMNCPDLTSGQYVDCDDGWWVEFTPDSGRTWRGMVHPDTVGAGIRYVGPVTPWTWVSQGFTARPWGNLYAYHNNPMRFRIVFEAGCNSFIAEGMKFDSFKVDYREGFERDITTRSIQVRYPNIAQRPFRFKAYYQNIGQDTLNTIQGFWSIQPGINSATFRTRFDLIPGATMTRDTLRTIATAGDYKIRAWFSVAEDNHANDTMRVDTVHVQPVGSDPEVGYDTRKATHYYPYLQGHGPLVHFTTHSDAVLTGSFDIRNIKAQFDLDTTGVDRQIRLHVYSGGTTHPGATELYNQLVTVPANQTGQYSWSTFDMTGVTTMQGLLDDFWVWFEVINPSTTYPYPAILGDLDQGWTDIHNYSWDGTATNPVATDYYMIHATIAAGNAVRDLPGALPMQWSLSQNYPNPFNPTTEIRFSVPRAEQMSIKVYNIMGEEVATLVNGMGQPGTHVVTFDGSNLASGVYVCRLEAASFTATQKMLLMK
jgi:hypothetical protein